VRRPSLRCLREVREFAASEGYTTHIKINPRKKEAYTEKPRQAIGILRNKLQSGGSGC